MSDLSVRGPVAPKDPTVKRPFFYVMRNKEICGSPQPDGTGVQFIFESDGRLENSARLVGNVQDEVLIELMHTTEGLRKLVHSIGVSVQKEGAPVDVKFVFQMYGHTDPYVSGTSLSMELPSDGMEMVMNLEACTWSDDDNIPGQIRFHLPEAGMQAKVSVCFYLNDGYEAPEQPGDREIDFEGTAYQAIIKKSLLQMGNNHRLKKAIDKARAGEQVTIGFIGGSITQGAGAIPINDSCYAYRTFEGFCEMTGRGLQDNIRYVKAGVGGTPSELGMVRYEKDVLNDGEITPDIMVIEFAVNDEGDETKGECYDSLARKIYNGPGEPAVILLYAVFANDWNLEERLGIVGKTYKLPMVSTRASVVEQFYLSEADGGVLSKNQFFYDMYHPTNVGHRIMSDGILNLLHEVDKAPMDEAFSIDSITPPIGGEFEKVYLVDRRNIDTAACMISYETGSFGEPTQELQFVERDRNLQGTPEFADNWHYDGSNATGFAGFKAKISCSAILVVYMDSASPTYGCADVYVDGEKKLTIDPHIVGWTHCNPLIAARGMESAEHEIEIRMKAGDEDKKFTLLGFGIVD